MGMGHLHAEHGCLPADVADGCHGLGMVAADQGPATRPRRRRTSLRIPTAAGRATRPRRKMTTAGLAGCPAGGSATADGVLVEGVGARPSTWIERAGVRTMSIPSLTRAWIA